MRPGSKVTLKKGERAGKVVTVPSIAKLNKMADEGICTTPDGCKVEPDGCCTHGYKSWLLYLGYI